jgi:hypothetical protein
VDIEQIERALAFGRGHDRADAEPVSRSGDASRDLAAVDDEQRRSGRGRGPTVATGRCHKRVNRVICDTPTAPTRLAGNRPPRSAGRTAWWHQPRRQPARTQPWTSCRDRRISASRCRPTDRASGRTSLPVNALKASCASSLGRRAMTRAVCTRRPVAQPRTSRYRLAPARLSSSGGRSPRRPDRRVQRPPDHLVDQTDPRRPRRVNLAAGESARRDFADLGDLNG